MDCEARIERKLMLLPVVSLPTEELGLIAKEDQSGWSRQLIGWLNELESLMSSPSEHLHFGLIGKLNPMNKPNILRQALLLAQPTSNEKNEVTHWLAFTMALEEVNLMAIR